MLFFQDWPCFWFVCFFSIRWWQCSGSIVIHFKTSSSHHYIKILWKTWWHLHVLLHIICSACSCLQGPGASHLIRVLTHCGKEPAFTLIVSVVRNVRGLSTLCLSVFSSTCLLFSLFAPLHTPEKWCSITDVKTISVRAPAANTACCFLLSRTSGQKVWSFARLSLIPSLNLWLPGRQESHSGVLIWSCCAWNRSRDNIVLNGRNGGQPNVATQKCH